MKVGITASAFDLLHAGHCEMLREAKNVCDYLICCLHIDPSEERGEKEKPLQSIVERHIVLSSSKYVDEIIPYKTEDDLLKIIQFKIPDVRVIGEDYINKNFTGKLLCEKMGIRIYYNQRKHSVSSTEIRKILKNQHNETKI